MDDVIQIAAIKIRGRQEGVEGSEFSIFIRTDRHIPRFLSNGVDNPMKPFTAMPKSTTGKSPRLILPSTSPMPTMWPAVT